MIRILLMFALVLSLPLLASADDPRVQTDEKGLEARTVPADKAESIQPHVPGSPRERLTALLEAGRLEVRQLTEQLLDASTPDERHELQLRIVATKQAHRLRFLEEHVKIAEEQGDAKRATEARIQMESLKERIAEVKRPMPLVDRPAPVEGGSK